MERDRKILFIELAVIIFAILILVIWIFNLKNIWRREKEINRSNNKQQWLSIKNDLNNTIVDLKSKFTKIKDIQKKEEEVRDKVFLQNLLQTTKNKASSTKASSISVTSSKKVNQANNFKSVSPQDIGSNCPSYINCMPTIGASPSCQIPSGCQGITKIVY